MVEKNPPLKLSRSSNGSMTAIKRKVQMDGWKNILTGIGTARDKITYSTVSWIQTTRERADGLYAGDDLGGKIASIIPFDGIRAGINWNIEEAKENDELIPWLDGEYERLKIWTKLYEAWVWARVYGGALIVLSVKDGKELSEPLEMDQIGRLNSLNIFDRWQWQIEEMDMIVDPSSEFYGQPEFYTYVGDNIIASATDGSANRYRNFLKVHRSRVIRFDGNHLSDRLWKLNQFWHDSIYGKLYEPLRNYTMVQNSIAAMLQDFNQPVWKMAGLAAALQQDDDELVVKRLHQANISRSVVRAIVIDENDSFENVTSPTGGIDTLVQKTTDRLTAASNIPHTRLMGESPAGLGGSGRSELADYYDFVGAQQKVYLFDPINRLTKLLFAQSDAPYREPEKWCFKFNPLEVPTEKEVKETQLIQANIDEVYMRNGVLDSFEVAKSRFGSGEYSFETHLEDDRSDSEVEDPREQGETIEPVEPEEPFYP